MPQNRVETDVQVKGNALEAIQKNSAAFKQWIDTTVQLTQRLREAEKPAASFPSVMARAARAAQEDTLAAQEMKIGYVEGLGDITEETFSFADAVNRALGGMRSYVEDVGFSVGKLWEGFNKKFGETFDEQAKFVKAAGEKAFTDLHKTLDDGLSGVFATAFTKNTEKTLKSWEKFVENLEATFYQSLGRMASALVQENLLAPLFKLGQDAAGALLAAGKGLLGLAEGGLVTKPTLALVGEAGPEVVLPLEAAGEFVKGSVIEAAKTAAFEEAASTFAASELGTAASAAGIGDVAAAEAAGLTTGAALFVLGDALNAALGGQSAVRAIGDIAFGERGKQGLLERALGGLGLPAFRKRGGEFNLPMIQALYAEALAAPPVPPFSFNELMARLGSDDPGRARALLAPYLGEGGFVTGPTLALVGEGGREAVLPLDSPSSMRGLTESLRPIVRGLFEEMGFRAGAGSGKQTVVIQLVLNGRAIQEISREVDVTNERRPRTPRAPRPAWSGV